MHRILAITDKEEQGKALMAAIQVIRSGGVIAIPTDTVYGIAASAFDESAIARIFQIKKRDENKSIAVLLGDAGQAAEIAKSFPPKAIALASAYWPGGLTLLVGKKNGLPASLSGNEKIGLRIPDHPFARELIRCCGPLATSSANFSGQPPALCLADFSELLEDQLDLIIDDGPVSGSVASTVVDCTVNPVQILREGAISKAEIDQC